MNKLKCGLKFGKNRGQTSRKKGFWAFKKARRSSSSVILRITREDIQMIQCESLCDEKYPGLTCVHMWVCAHKVGNMWKS